LIGLFFCYLGNYGGCGGFTLSLWKLHSIISLSLAHRNFFRCSLKNLFSEYQLDI
jgi:hypothetical protein